MEMEPTKNLTFKVVRKNPELIAPAKPTPHEFKLLSDIDDQDGLRFQVPLIQFYRRNSSVEGKDPVKVIRDAIAKALIFYYPFAGRLRELAAKKLVVECTGEGVMFIEADADVTLLQFGDTLLPNFPYLQDLLYDVPGSAGVLHCPLLLIQVTRLRCGGFIVGLRFNHTMCDGAGIVQFMSAVGEFVRGAVAPSILPIWDRHLLSARNPLRVTCTLRHFDEVPDAEGALFPPDDLVHHNFFFGAAELSALRSRLPPHLRLCSRAELITACVWRCRTIAISPKPTEDVRIVILVDTRGRFDTPLPDGYYGNGFASPIAVASAGDLTKNPLHFAVEMVRKAKAEVTEEYMKSFVDLLVMSGRSYYTMVRTFMVSVLTNVGLEHVDYGWGKPVYGGLGETAGALSGIMSFYTPRVSGEGENGVVVPMCLPSNAMEVFVEELERMLKGGVDDRKIIIPSAL